MDFLLAQGITETVEVKEAPPQPKTEEPVGGSVREEITVPLPSAPPIMGIPGAEVPLIAPVPRLPMGTIIETITMPAPRIPLGTIPNIPEAKVTPVRKEMEDPAILRESTEKFVKDPNGTVTYIKQVCDGEVNLGPFKSCLKEFTGVPAIGWIAAAAGLIVLWKWLDYKFRK